MTGVPCCPTGQHYFGAPDEIPGWKCLRCGRSNDNLRNHIETISEIAEAEDITWHEAEERWIRNHYEEYERNLQQMIEEGVVSHAK